MRVDSSVGESEQSTADDGSMSSLEGVVVVSNPQTQQADMADDRATRVAPETHANQKGNGTSERQETKEVHLSNGKATPSKNSNPPEVMSTVGDEEKKDASKQGLAGGPTTKASAADNEKKEEEEEGGKKEENVDKPQPPLLRTLIRVYGFVMLLAQLSMLIYVFVLFVNPCLLWYAENFVLANKQT